MGKGKGKSTGVTNREALLRMNFLYGAATLLASSGVSNSANGAIMDLSRFYISTMQSVAQKLVIRIDKDVKATICKTCQALLIPGITSRLPKIRKTVHLLI